MVPAPLLRLPKLKAQDGPYLQFYYTLAESRQMGMSAPNALAVADIAALCSLTGIASTADKSKYLRTTQRLDRAYREHWHDTNKKA